MIKKLFFNWHKNKEEEMWMDPPNGAWKNVITDDIILIDYDGENLIQTEKERRPIKECWSVLIEEAEKNLVEEDNASSIIIALIKGYETRNKI